MTILFYVPRWTKEEDLQIVFGRDYVIAGARSAKEMVVQAQLAGRINTSTSIWRLEKQSNKRSRSRSRNHKGGKRAAASSSSSSEEREELEKRERKPTSSVIQKESPTSSDEASHSDPSAHSVDALQSSGGWDHIRQSSAPTPPPEAYSVPESATRLDRSMTLSEESGYIASGSNSTGDGGVRSLESSIHSLSSASQTRSDDDAITDAKLVTLHLDKLDGGIWPILVSGPASISLLQSENSSPFLSRSRHQSLNAALSEALKQPNLEDQQSVIIEDEANAQLDDSFTQSTTTIDTMSSDDSTTVLGTQSTGEDEDLYEMDPTSLALMGISHSKQGARSPFGSTSTQESSSAFEHFKRAWRRAEIPLATKKLVEEYLPLSPPRSNTSNMLRSRLTASLGGPSALARLYVSYARLHLPCFQNRQSPLAFPLGGLTNPFGGGHGQDYPSSPRPQGDQSIGHEPLTYLREARNIDKNVVISEEEWNEALAMAAQSPSAEGAWRWDQPEVTNKSSDGERASQARQSASEGRKREKTRRKKKVGSKLHRDDLSKSNEKFTSDQGLAFVLVSRVALISVMVAGGVAVAGWWRRAASAGGG